MALFTGWSGIQPKIKAMLCEILRKQTRPIPNDWKPTSSEVKMLSNRRNMPSEICKGETGERCELLGKKTGRAYDQS